MTELEEIKEKLTPAARRVLDAAIEESKTRQHYYLGVEHLFLAFAKVEETFFREVMEDPTHVPLGGSTTPGSLCSWHGMPRL